MEGTPQKRKKSLGSSKTQTATRPLLSHDEWDFGSVDDLDLPACYLWEYWREKCRRDPSVAAALNSLRQEVSADDGSILQHDQRELSFRRLILQQCPDLPEVYAESLKIHGKFNLYLWSSVNPLSLQMDGLANISDAYFPCRSFQSLDPVAKQIIRGKATPKISKGQFPPLEEMPITHAVEPNQQLHEVETVSFQINWNHTDASIQEAFRAWVLLSRGDRKASLSKGLGPGKSITKTILKSLKDLGAMRLMAHYGSTQAASNAVKKVNRPRFFDKAEWSKAKKHAESVLQDFKILSG